MSLTFQRSFKLELDNVAKILAAIVEMPFGSRHQIADFTGIPIGKNEIHGKVDPTIIYATYCGLITTVADNGTKKRILTDFGKIVFEYDKNLRRNETRWGIHYFLSSIRKGAPAWSYFVHRFLPKNEQFTRDNLNRELSAEFSDLSVRYVNENERTLLQCYTEFGALGKLGLLESYEKDTYLRGVSDYPNSLFFGYVLAELWDEMHSDKSMISPDILFEPGHFATTFRLTSGDLQNVLDEMSAVGAIRQLREAPPFQVVRNWGNRFELLRRAYQES